MRYVIGIGSNIGDKKENIERAIAAIETLPKTRIVLKSSIYETQPVGYEDQDDFYNICLEVQSVFNPFEMIGAVLGIEAGFGRVRTIKDGPRIIVPHPQYKNRRFVLEPLCEMYPDGRFMGYIFGGLSEQIENQKVKKLED